METSHTSPPFSPVLVSGLALRHIPISVLQPFFTKAMDIMYADNIRVFQRLEEVNSPSFLINPTDLPFIFVLETKPASLTLFKAEELELGIIHTDAQITGAFELLIQLLEGKIDGDAVFFSRDLQVEGDTEAILALRNALDGNDIDVFAEILSPLGKFQLIPQGILSGVRGLFKQAEKDMTLFKDSITQEVARDMDNNNATMDKMSDQVSELMREHRKQQRRKKKG